MKKQIIILTLLTVSFWNLHSQDLTGRGKMFDYVFRISTNQTVNNNFKDLKVEIINNESDTIRLSNLVFVFYVDNNGYWATAEKIRFFDNAIILRSKEHFIQTVSIDSFTFKNFQNYQQVSITEMKTKLRSSKFVRIQASINDFRRLQNLSESSSLTHSNIIELRAK